MPEIDSARVGSIRRRTSVESTQATAAVAVAVLSRSLLSLHYNDVAVEAVHSNMSP